MSTVALFEKYYFKRPDFITGIQQFQDLILSEISGDSKVLEIGAGASNPVSQFLSMNFRNEGVDVSDEIFTNEFVAKARTYDGTILPYGSESFDACVSYYVVEHIADPIGHLREVARVLRPGGAYLFCTPNLWHYVTLGSALLPHSFHRLLANRLRGLGPGAHDPFPTWYRVNTRNAIRKSAAAAGLPVSRLNMIEFEPCYGRWHGALFYPMMAYERAVNSSPLLAGFRVNIHAVLRKRTDKR